MREADLSRVLLVRACEETDPEGRALPLADRARAMRQAGAIPPQGEAHEPGALEDWVVRRAEPLASRIESDHPALRRARIASGLRIPLLGVAAAGLLLGLALDALGSGRKLDLLSIPVLGLLGWNLAIYAVGAARGLWRGRSRAAGRLRRLAVALASRRGLAAAPWQASALQRFGALWNEAAGPLLAHRAARLLHVGAAATGLGVVARMYLSSLRVQYVATWESTLLDAGQVHALVSAVLGPGALVLGTAVPGLAEVEAIQRPEHGDAAVWLHLFAATVGLVVVAPRIVLATWSALRERRAARALRLDLDSPWILMQLAPGRGADTAVELTPFSYRPSTASLERQRELCLELFGNRARLRILDPVAYGDALPPPQLDGAHERCRVVVFNLAQSPEQEVHGAVVEELVHWAEEAAGRPGPARVLVLLDEEPHARRIVPEGGEHALERLEQRRRAWSRVIRAGGLESCVLPDTRDVDEATLGEALHSLWSADTGVARPVAQEAGG